MVEVLQQAVMHWAGILAVLILIIIVVLGMMES